MSDSSMIPISITPTTPAPGDVIQFKATAPSAGYKLQWKLTAGPGETFKDLGNGVAELQTTATSYGERKATLGGVDAAGNSIKSQSAVANLRSVSTSTNSLSDSVAKIAADGIKVSSEKVSKTDDQALWVKIRQCTGKRGFKIYSKFIDDLLCKGSIQTSSRVSNPESKAVSDCVYTHGVHAYDVLKAATEVFVLCESCCSDSTIKSIDADDEEARLGYTPTLAQIQDMLKDYLSPSTLRLPYLDTILTQLRIQDAGTKFPFCTDSLRLSMCLYELIWSYWHEESMLVQTMNAVAMRFQNRRVPGNGRDPLSNMEIAPLRPLSNMLWGYIQDGADGRRLTVARRAYEYAHEYGLQLVGKAVGDLRPAESRSRFLESFHNLLYLCADYYRENTNQWITPDPYPLLEALRSVHVLLAEGAHNQFGDMTTTSRAEMMVEQWLLSQAPMNDFLQSRAMVPYDEPWMGQVDAMRRLMGWPDISVTYFHRLAVFGEQILLSIRWGNWSSLDTVPAQAANWAIYWKPEIQGYIEAYRAATKVELAPSFRAAVPVDTTQPAVLLSRRMSESRTRETHP